MIQNLKKLALGLSAAVLLSLPVLVPATASAQDQVTSGLSCGATLNASDAACDLDTAGANEKVNSIIKLVINVFSIVVGVVAVIMIIIGGLKYIMSGGDATSVTGAKNTILYAIIGLVVVALSQFIVRYVLGRVTTQ